MTRVVLPAAVAALVVAALLSFEPRRDRLRWAAEDAGSLVGDFPSFRACQLASPGLACVALR